MNISSLRLLNTAGYLLVLTMNTLANALPLNGYTTGELSALYPNRFVPAGFTFSIWGVIYLALLGFVVYQFRDKGRALTQAVGPWFFISCLANAGWILAWHYRYPILSLAIMVFLLFSLIQIYLRTNPFNWKKHWAGRLPFQLYLGWITVATIANATAVLVDLGWEGGPISEINWAAIMAGVGALAGAFFIWRFKDLAYGLVILWALYGIYSRQVEGAGNSLGLAIIIGAVLIVGLLPFSLRRSGA